MDRIQILIVDDEPLALDLLENYVRRTPILELVGKASSVQGAIQLLEQKAIDLLILDIQMPGKLGTELAKKVHAEQRVIFSTAFADYAVEGYRLNALDYLLKPYDYEEFLRAVNKAKDYFATSPSYFFVKSEYQKIRIDIARIQFIEGMKDYVKIFMEGEGKPILTLMSLKSLQEILPMPQFVRVHRSYLVNMEKASVVGKGVVQIASYRIPVAERQRDFMDHL